MIVNIDYILQNHGIGIKRGSKSSDIIPPPPCTGFSAIANKLQVDLTWINPVDTDFLGVRIVRKLGSFPTDVLDGTLIYNGANTSYTDATVVNGTTYYYRIFSFDWDNNYNTMTLGQVSSVTPMQYLTYGVKIDTTNPNPETAITYIDDSIGYTKSTGNNGTFNYGSWQNKFPFNQIKPCVFKNGVVNYYLSPVDYTKKLDGTPSVLTGIDGDVMIEFPKIYWKIETTGNDLYIRYSDGKVDDDYKCLAHMRGTVEKDKCYVGAYLSTVVDNILHCYANSTPTASKSIGVFRSNAQVNGTGYDQIGYYQILMLQVLFIIMFKNRDSQTALGRGYVDGNASIIQTGNTNLKGLFYGEATGKLQNKFCGIEDFWGNMYYFLDGLFIDVSGNILISNQNFNNTGIGYSSSGISPLNINGYIFGVQGGTKTGFLIKSTGGSSSTYYCDSSAINPSCLPVFGAKFNGGNGGGAFNISVNGVASLTSSTAGARLMYL